MGGRKLPNGLSENKNAILSNPNHDFSRPFEGGPQDIGFLSLLITITGIQSAPYSFFREGILQTEKSDIRWWGKGECTMHEGNSKIINSGEGDINWDSIAHNMIVVNETIRFLDDHIENRQSDPFFAYVASSVHITHSPPRSYIDGSPIEDTQNTAHMDMLYEVDLVLGSLIKALEDRQLIEDTIIVFTSDNGGLGNVTGGAEFGHKSNGGLKGVKGSLNEGGHRIPMIMRYDRALQSGETRKNIVRVRNCVTNDLSHCITIPKH